MIHTETQEDLKTQNLELQLYRSFSLSTSLSACVNGFAKTIKQELQLEDVIVLDKLENEKWKVNANQDLSLIHI